MCLFAYHAEANHHQSSPTLQRVPWLYFGQLLVLIELTAKNLLIVIILTSYRSLKRLHGLNTGISTGWPRLLGSCVHSNKRWTSCNWRKIRMSRCSVHGRYNQLIRVVLVLLSVLVLVLLSVLVLMPGNSWFCKTIPLWWCNWVVISIGWVYVCIYNLHDFQVNNTFRICTVLVTRQLVLTNAEYKVFAQVLYKNACTCPQYW